MNTHLKEMAILIMELFSLYVHFYPILDFAKKNISPTKKKYFTFCLIFEEIHPYERKNRPKQGNRRCNFQH